ncbi:YdeI family protein [Rhodococcus sp. NPDC058521]|uniref:YdeI/OmpD-associated family protein n=1 Tax=Rhodococcus sp. NPDC058521 TaxID=3346536 RepID=UPI003658EA53
METLVAGSAAVWRDWLNRNGQSEKEIWLIIHHKDSGMPSLRYHEAIEHALCFGWIDGLHHTHDEHSSRLRFTPRNPRSTWSSVNRTRAAQMIEQGLMTEHGQALVDLAKEKGTWQVLPDDGSELPADLHDALHRNEAARTSFETFPPSSKRPILEWVVTAKKADTRRRRIDRTVELAAAGIRANHPGVRMSD